MGNQPSQQNIPQRRPPPPHNRHIIQKPIPQSQPPPQPKPQHQINHNLLSQVAHPQQFIAPPTKSVSTLMDRPQSTKIGIREADIMNINQRVEEFRKNIKDEEHEFLTNLEKAKETFYEKQKSKQNHFNEELEEFEMKYNPFRILHLDYNATEQDIKKAYHKFALKYHPDKPNGNAKKFMMVTQAYVYLLQKIKEMKGNKSHFEMQEEAKNYFEEMEQKRQEIKQSSYKPEEQMEISEKNFNLDKFNKIFEQNKLPSQYDKGYGGDWGDDSDHEEQVVFNKKFSIDLFNNTFNQMKQNKIEKKPERQLIIIEEPQPQILSNLPFEELGKDINDFTNDRINTSMQFTDYKAAYTRNNTLEYDEKFNRGDYKNIDHLVRERSSANFELTEQDKARLQKREMLLKQQEEERIMNLCAWDKMAEQYSQRVSQHFIKNGKN